MEQPRVGERSLQTWLHLHGADLFDGEVEVTEGFGLLLWRAVEQQFGKGEMGSGDLGANGVRAA